MKVVAINEIFSQCIVNEHTRAVHASLPVLVAVVAKQCNSSYGPKERNV